MNTEWVSISQRSDSYRNQINIEQIETEKPNPDLQQHARSSVQKYRSNIESNIPNHADIESIEPKPTLLQVLVPSKKCPYRLPQGTRCFPTACRQEAKASFPSPLTGPHRLEGATFANRLAESRNYKHSMGDVGDGHCEKSTMSVTMLECMQHQTKLILAAIQSWLSWRPSLRGLAIAQSHKPPSLPASQVG